MNRAQACNKRRSRAWRRIATDVRAATAIEYGLIVAVVVIAMVGALVAVGGTTSDIWNNVSAKVTNAH